MKQQLNLKTHGDDLARSITQAASRQTFYTVRFLVDSDRIPAAYRAYAYFRWVDDWLDGSNANWSERLAFIQRQRALVDCCYINQVPHDLCDEERMLMNIIARDHESNSGLQSYIEHMMAVMAFDAERRGHLVSEQQLTDYSHHLAVAVTDALHYFIGHNDPAPFSESRYLAATAAHIVHMLRDTVDDAAAGYFNISREWVEFYDMDPCEFESESYREWVRHRVQLARSYFEAGKQYLRQVKNFRCRIAGYAYLERFQCVLTAIESDGYLLRRDYSKHNNPGSGLGMFASVFLNSLRSTN